MKTFFRRLVASLLAWQVKRLRQRHTFKTVGVVGSIGKTSSKLAIAEVLSARYKVQYQTGNYNDLVSVPLVLFGQNMPSLFNPFAWLKIFIINERVISKQYPYDVVVLELGTDGPGQIAAFKKYLRLDIAVVAAITPEHMEYFDNLDAVAKEELSVREFTDQLIVNKDLVSADHLLLIPDAISYAISNSASYMANAIVYSDTGVAFEISKNNQPIASATIAGFSEVQIYSALSAAVVADKLGLTADEILLGLTTLQPVAGRMQKLAGIKNTTVIDDSYNASPEAVKSALQTLYRIQAPQKIALLGNMNELGSFSPDAHVSIGEFCNPQEIAEVITLGPDANKYLAPAARQAGCKATEFESPYQAGEYIKSILQENAVVLIKGSQNKVFAEEAIKPLLANPADAKKLVRQSSTWLELKQKQFNHSGPV